MSKLVLPSADQALPGRDTEMQISNQHFVNGQPLKPPFAAGLCSVVFGMGCFWVPSDAFGCSLVWSLRPWDTPAG